MKYYSIREDVCTVILKKLDPAVLKVFLFIYAQYQFKGKKITLSYTNIQQSTNLSRGSVSKALTFLVTSDLITRHKKTENGMIYSVVDCNIDNLINLSKKDR